MLISVVAVFPATSIILASYIYKRTHKLNAHKPTLIAIAFATTELVRTNLSPFGVAPLAISIDSITLLQNAKWGGQWALSLFIVFIAASAEHLLHNLFAENKPGPNQLKIPAINLAAITFHSLAFGVESLQHTTAPSDTIKVNLLSTNFKTESSPEKRWKQIEWLIDNSTGYNADLTLWPELLTDNPLANQNLLDLIRERWSHEPGVLAIPTTHFENRSKFNATILFDRSGSEIQLAKKHVLAPYWEHRPSWLLPPNQVSFTSGPPNKPFVGLTHTYAVITCVEEIAPLTIDSQIQYNPELIASASSNEQSGLWGSHQQTQSARIRAIEYGIPIIRSSNAGWTTIFDQNGTTILKTNKPGPNIHTIACKNTNCNTLIAKYGQNTIALSLTLVITITLSAHTIRKTCP
jgi:apolipoprotein N-acyltransferase